MSSRPILALLQCVLFLGLLNGCSNKEEIHYKLQHTYNVADPQFRRSLGNLLGPPLVEGNAVASLRNGDEVFPAMLAGIRSAQHNINFETFIYWRGDVATQFTEALVERAKAGVKVHMIVDAVGSGAKIDRDSVKALTDAGVRLERYHAVAWYNPFSAARINNRTHRKLLIVDGQLGFIGGIGIADEWKGNAQDKDHWRDMHYRVEGPAVLQLQSAFCDNWMKTTGEVLDGPEYYPESKHAGTVDAQVFKSDSLGGSESMELMFLLSLTAAEKHIRMGNAYFVPDEMTIHALVDAAHRGVKVQIIVPGPHLDEKIVRPASRITWGRLLESGVEIYEYQTTMYHTKLLVVDDRWVSIGSANLDSRSFKLNDEANLNVLDERFAAEQAQIFDDDLKQSKQYTLEQWKHRSLFKRISEGLVAWLSPML
jgi:cardiolipin synthase